jgi:malate/lactate dehydrogenase
LKLAIIGASGLLGSTTAFLAGKLNILEEIILISRNKNLLRHHIMDMEHALLPYSKTKVIEGEYEDIKGCDIILITVGAPERKVETRDEYLRDNVVIMKSVLENMKPYYSGGIVIVATNPIDVFNYYAWEKLKGDRNRFLGFSSNDSLRLKWSVSKVTGKAYDQLEGFCIGEHGMGQIPLLDQIKWRNKPLKLTSNERIRVIVELGSWFGKMQSLDCGRTSGWTSAVTLTEMIESIVLDQNKIIECSIVLEGDLGFDNVSIGVPVRVGKNGVNNIEMPTLTSEQSREFKKIIEKIQEQIQLI